MLNKVIIMGRLTADPELRQTTTGTNTCRFTVACDRNRVAQGQERQADFITVIAWNKSAEFVSRYFSKGKMIIVEGNLRTSSYDDKRYPEVKHYVTEVWAENIMFGETKSASQGGNGGYNAAPQQFQQPQYNNSQPRQQYAAPQSSSAAPISVGDLGDFEEVIGGEDNLPF